MSWPSPSFAWSQRRRSSAISSARPTSGVRPPTTLLSKRPRAVLSPTTRHNLAASADALEFVQPEFLVVEGGAGETMG